MLMKKMKRSHVKNKGTSGWQNGKLR